MKFYEWKIYLFATMALLGAGLVFGAIYCAVEKGRNRFVVQNICAADILAALYGGSVVITVLTCEYLRAAWLGTDSWYMGALAQLLFAGTFLVFSWFKAPAEDVIWMNLLASA